jgi:hypothetical protein
VSGRPEYQVELERAEWIVGMVNDLATIIATNRPESAVANAARLINEAFCALNAGKDIYDMAAMHLVEAVAGAAEGEGDEHGFLETFRREHPEPGAHLRADAFMAAVEAWRAVLDGKAGVARWAAAHGALVSARLKPRLPVDDKPTARRAAAALKQEWHRWQRAMAPHP